MSKREKRKSIGQIRRAQRAAVKHLNDNGIYLSNPDASPSYDRHEPIDSDSKAIALGMEPVSPKRLFDLPPGDAGAGQTVYRRVQLFYPLNNFDDFIPGLGGRFAEYPYSRAIAIATNRSKNQKPQNFHVSMYGIGATRNGIPAGGIQQPLSSTEILNLQFEQIFIREAGGVAVPITDRYLPAVNVCQARVMVHDESGQRFYDFDVIGNRSATFYAWGVTVFALIKNGGFEVDEQNLQVNEIQATGYQNDIVGARVLPVSTNVTESMQMRTISVVIDPSVSIGRGRCIPIPPGSKRVQIFSNNPDPAGDGFFAQFVFGRVDPGGNRADLGDVEFIAGLSRTGIVSIPNAPQIAILTGDGDGPVTGFSVVFEVEPS